MNGRLGGKKSKREKKTLGPGKGEHRAARGGDWRPLGRAALGSRCCASRGGKARSVLGPGSTADRRVSLAPSLPALRALRPSAAPGKPAVLTARRAGRAGEVWKRRPSAPTLREPGPTSVLGLCSADHGTPWRRPRVQAAALLGTLPRKLAGTLPPLGRPTRGRLTVGAPLPPHSSPPPQALAEASRCPCVEAISS